jgi:hypothetical protein
MDLPEHLTGYEAALAAEAADAEHTSADALVISAGATGDGAVVAGDSLSGDSRDSRDYGSSPPLGLPESPPYSQAAMDTALSRYTSTAEPVHTSHEGSGESEYAEPSYDDEVCG